MKNKIIIILLLLLVGVSVFGSIYYNKVQKDKQAKEIILNNSIAERKLLKSKIIAQEAKLVDFKNSSSQMDLRIKELMKEAKIKEKKLISLQYTIDTIKKTTVIKFEKDTLFRDSISKDTTLGDRFYSISLKLRYPSTIEVTPSFTIERAVFFSDVKETIKPKKHWPWYYFQKKKTVVQVDIKDTNPYIIRDTLKSKFLYIVK